MFGRRASYTAFCFQRGRGNKMNLRYLSVFLALFGSMSLLSGAMAQDTAPTGRDTKKTAPTTQAPQKQDDNGDLVWQQQCSRCHAVPDGFSPRIAGTVVRHMRVRASLSKQEEEELLRFLNP